MKWVTAVLVLALGAAAALLPEAEAPAPRPEPGIASPPVAVCPTEEGATRSSSLDVMSTIAGVGQVTIFSGGGSAGSGSFDTGASGSASVPVGEIAAVGSAAALVEFPTAESATASVTTGPTVLSAETCSRIPDSQVIVGGGSTVNDIPLRLQLMNPYSATAVADITAFSESGRESSEALRSIIVPARSSVVVDIGSILSGRETLNLIVEATRGSIVTSATTEVGGDQAVWRAVAPEQTWYVPFPVFSGSREVVIASSTPNDVAYQIDVFGPGGLEEAAIEGTISGGGQEVINVSEISQAALAVRVVTTAPVGVFARLTGEGGLGIAAASPQPTNDWLLPGAGSGADTAGRLAVVNVGVEVTDVTVTEVRESSRSRIFQVQPGQILEVELDAVDSNGVSIASDGQVVPFWIARRGAAVAVSGGFPLLTNE
ncbi:MAG TPA: DUF5719 family protein [Acidimicrobiia bacterium]|nr:DUF5719 family protein [Acidimicrobiia bacterium]